MMLRAGQHKTVNRGLRGGTTQGGHENLGSGVTPGPPRDLWKNLENLGEKNLKNEIQEISKTHENGLREVPWTAPGPLEKIMNF